MYHWYICCLGHLLVIQDSCSASLHRLRYPPSLSCLKLWNGWIRWSEYQWCLLMKILRIIRFQCNLIPKCSNSSLLCLWRSLPFVNTTWMIMISFIDPRDKYSLRILQKVFSLWLYANSKFWSFIKLRCNYIYCL